MITGTTPFFQDLAFVGLPILTLGLILFRGWCRRRARRHETLAELYQEDKGEALTIFHKSPRP